MYIIPNTLCDVIVSMLMALQIVGFGFDPHLGQVIENFSNSKVSINSENLSNRDLIYIASTYVG